MKLIRSVSHHWSEGGATQLARKTLGRAARVFHNSIDFLVYRLDDLDVEPVALAEGHLVELTMEELLAAGYFKAVEAPDEMERRFRQGETCLGLFFGDELGHVSWMVPGFLPIDRGISPVPVKGAVGIYDMFTLGEFRGRGAQTAALAELSRVAYRKGYRTAVAGIYENNAPSRHVFEKVGFRNIGTLRYRRTLWVERVRVPELHLD